MKMQKKLNVVLVVLVVALVSLVSFGGVYYTNKNEMSNYLPSYLLGTDLKGYRQVTLKVAENDADEEEVDGEATESEETEEVTYYREDYIKSAEVFRARLKSIKVDDFSVSCDENSGAIVITLPENDQTDIILADLVQPGKFTVKDSGTEEELLTNEDVRKVEVGTQESVTTTQTYMSIYFTTKGTSKLKEVSKTYRNVDEEESASEENTLNELTEENAVEEEASEESEEKTTKQVTFNIDDATLMTTEFTEIIDNGVLSLTLGASNVSEGSKDELYSAYNVAAIIENPALPVKYEVEGNTYIASMMDSNDVKAIIYIEIAIALVIVLVLVAKYRAKGLLAGIMSVGFVAILLIVLRYANVILSIEGILAIELGFIINSIFGFMMCTFMQQKDLSEKEKSKEYKEMIKKYTCILIPELVVAIICCFTQWAPLLSFGMVIFWSVAISWIYNILLSKVLS